MLFSGTSFRRTFWVICIPLLPRMNMTMPAQPSTAYHTRSLPCNLLNRYSLWDIHDVLFILIFVKCKSNLKDIFSWWSNYPGFCKLPFHYLCSLLISWTNTQQLILKLPNIIFYTYLCICLQGWHQFSWMIHETVISFLSKMIYKKTLFERHLHFPQGWVYLLNNQLSCNMVHVDRVLWKALHWPPHL